MTVSQYLRKFAHLDSAYLGSISQAMARTGIDIASENDFDLLLLSVIRDDLYFQWVNSLNNGKV